MKPVTFKSADTVLRSPERWNHGDVPCRELHILRAHGWIYSCWKPSIWERIKLLFGHPVKLVVASPMTMPPVALEVGEP